MCASCSVVYAAQDSGWLLAAAFGSRLYSSVLETEASVSSAASVDFPPARTCVSMEPNKTAPTPAPKIPPQEIAVMMQPLQKTPAKIDAKAVVKGIPSRKAPMAPVQAPVPGSGIPTKAASSVLGSSDPRMPLQPCSEHAPILVSSASARDQSEARRGAARWVAYFPIRRARRLLPWVFPSICLRE